MSQLLLWQTDSRACVGCPFPARHEDAQDPAHGARRFSRKLARPHCNIYLWLMNRPTALERAFELARSGECATISEVRKRLSDEGHSAQQIEGPSLVRQLRDLIDRSRAA